MQPGYEGTAILRQRMRKGDGGGAARLQPQNGRRQYGGELGVRSSVG